MIKKLKRNKEFDLIKDDQNKRMKEAKVKTKGKMFPNLLKFSGFKDNQDK